jgi:hypothetical protein
MNPKGWYCLKGAFAAGDGETQAITNIDLHCSAKLAKSNLTVSLDSQKETIGVGVDEAEGAQLGIRIDATVALKRKLANEGACPN